MRSTAPTSRLPAYGQNKYLKDVNYHLFAPRLGISWDPTGNGNMAVRAGFGQFFQRDRTTPAYVNANNAPFSVSNTFTRTLDTAPANISGRRRFSVGWI